MAASVNIARIERDHKIFLQFDFNGDLSEELAGNAIMDWKNKLPADKSRIDLIYNCNGMTGFQTGARRQWQAAMKELKSQTGDIWVVCDNIFIITASKTMGLITGFNIKAVRSLDQVH